MTDSWNHHPGEDDNTPDSIPEPQTSTPVQATLRAIGQTTIRYGCENCEYAKSITSGKASGIRISSRLPYPVRVRVEHRATIENSRPILVGASEVTIGQECAPNAPTPLYCDNADAIAREVARFSADPAILASQVEPPAVEFPLSFTPRQLNKQPIAQSLLDHVRVLLL